MDQSGDESARTAEELQTLRARVAELEHADANQMRVEEVLSCERDSADDLVQVAQVIVLVLDSQGRIVRFNRYTAQLTGYRLDEVRGKDWFTTFLPERDQRRVRDIFAEAIDGTRVRGDVNAIVTKDGEERLIEWYDDPLIDARGNLVGLLCIGHDITERIRGEEALRQRTHDLGERIKELNCFYRVSDLVGRGGSTIAETFEEAVVLLPPAWQYPEITCARLSLRGREFKTDNFRETPWTQACDIVVGGEPVGVVEVCYLKERSEGDEGPFLAEERSLLKGVAERLGRIVERADTEKEKTKLEAQLHQAQKMEAVGQLAGGVAHDFNNLVTAISGAARVLKGHVGEDRDALQALSMIEQAVHQATEVTRSLLTFGRKVPTERQRVDVCDVVREAAQLLHRTLPASIDLMLDATEEPPLLITADPVELQQVVLNLAINARDAMPNGGKLRITVAPAQAGDPAEPQPSRSPAFARLTISDSGTGIRPEHEPRIFEPFFTTKPRGQGTGLGLAIVHGIVKAHGGSITALSTAGEGSTFTVTFPTAPDEPSIAPTPPSSVASTGQGELVVLAENHQYVREIMAATLESLGYKVLQTADQAALLECCKKHQSDIDLLVLGIDIPKGCALGCLQDLRARGIAAPAICAVDDVNADTRVRLPSDVVLLPKPFEMSELARRVGETLAAPSGTEQPS